MSEKPEASRAVPRAWQFLRNLRRSPRPVPELNAREAYRRWAPTYSSETAISALDEALAGEMLHDLPYGRLLDAGCGIGRRIASMPDATGMDASPEMLSMGSAANLVVGDVRDIPFASDTFDMVWCRLVLGHIQDVTVVYRELHRVCKAGGFLFITDFHPDAVTAGHRRTGTDRQGNTFGIEHYVHSNHEQLAGTAGLRCLLHRTGEVGPSVRDYYMQGIGEKAYKRDVGLKLLDAFLFQKSLA